MGQQKKQKEMTERDFSSFIQQKIAERRLKSDKKYK
jgi:hypothetical protein